MEYKKPDEHRLIPVIKQLTILRNTTTDKKEKALLNKKIHKYHSWVNRHKRLYLSKEKQNDLKSS